MKKSSLLDLLCSREPRISRKEMYARILCGEIFIDGQRVTNPRQMVPVTVAAEYRLPGPFVSRGGEKLAGVLKQWNINVFSTSFIDAGASTGGFTDCLLQHGASRVVAVEAGKNQLAYSLRSDQRVTVLENTNIMSVRALPFVPEAAVADLSLRSLRKAAAHILSLVSMNWLIALVKPQYEWRTPPADFDGVVDREAALRSILENLIQDLRSERVFTSRVAIAQLPGRKGNREFFCLLSTGEDQAGEDVEGMIARALKRGC